MIHRENHAVDVRDMLVVLVLTEGGGPHPVYIEGRQTPGPDGSTDNALRPWRKPATPPSLVVSSTTLCCRSATAEISI